MSETWLGSSNGTSWPAALTDARWERQRTARVKQTSAPRREFECVPQMRVVCREQERGL